MKIRNGYVSNSSSSSFVIYSWSSISDSIKDMILNPKNHIISLWEKLGEKYGDKHNCGNGSIYIDNENSEYDFGFINEIWDHKENKEKDSIEFTTSMDNFNMMKWVDYLGVKYEDLGENWGFFSDEEINMSENIENIIDRISYDIPKVYVCSAYRGDIENNIARAKRYCRDIALNGEIPVCPHIYFTQFLNDSSEHERNIGLKIGKQLIGECRQMNVYKVNGTISEGMKEEIEFAERKGIKIKFYDEN